MNPVTEDMVEYMESSVTGLPWAFSDSDGDLFVSRMPEEPDNCVCLYETGGIRPDPNYIYEKPTFQVRIRGPKLDYQTAWDQAKAILDVLHSLTGEVINSTRYIQVLALADIIPLGYDDNDRPILTINFEAHRAT